MEAYGQWIGTAMEERDIEDLLESAGWGVLSLAADDIPYSLPISFAYDGETVRFVFLEAGGSNTKFDYIAEGKTARLLVTRASGRFDWQSVAVTGQVSAVDRDSDEWDEHLETIDESRAWFSADFERAGAIEELHGWRLDPEEVRGVQVTADEM
jgi:nitroimidazol reductase NimA-like FMN-containing flavoprotein (pyridoxamine 5'-phosphate oxidase superfamily)